MIIKPHLESISATLIDHTNLGTLQKYIPEFVSITWLADINDTDKFLESKDMTRLDCVREMFAWRTLPTALETVKLTFALEGLTLGAVTHIIRHRMFSFSAQSTDPVSMEDHALLLNPAFDEFPHLQIKAKSLCKQLNVLYKDALDAGISYYDARSYQPRAREAKYMMSGNIKDFISFINTRLGRTNQPYEDNILALLMRKAILEAYPQVADILEAQMPPQKVQNHYISAINEKFNMNTFPPDELHTAELKKRSIDWSSAEFNHAKSREQYPGYTAYLTLFDKILAETCTRPQKVYLAGGWFTPVQDAVLNDVETLMGEQTKYDFFAPRLHNLGDSDTSQTDWDEIYKMNIDELDVCDYMIASTIGKDMGTLVEVGHFQEKGKPIIFYAPGLTGPFNLMLAKAAHAVCTTREELATAIEDLSIERKYINDIE